MSTINRIYRNKESGGLIYLTESEYLWMRFDSFTCRLVTVVAKLWQLSYNIHSVNSGIHFFKIYRGCVVLNGITEEDIKIAINDIVYDA